MKSSLRFAVAAAFAAAPSLVQAAALVEGDPVAGQRLFMSNNCYQCHGTVGQGGTGPTISPPHTPALGAFIGYVRHPAGEMPAFTAKVIGDADLEAIHAYLKAQPAPPATLPDLLTQPFGTK